MRCKTEVELLNVLGELYLFTDRSLAIVSRD